MPGASADGIRRAMVESGQPARDLAADDGQRYTTAEMAAAFEVLGFAAPFVVVRRRSDGATGTLGVHPLALGLFRLARG